jgi:tetratricopeptide (TPR) repeat protein
MPLAIELAASCVRMFTPEEIAKEIEGGIEFLTSSMKDLPSRHRSVQAVLDYSWELLGEDEKSVLMKLAVFHGGFTLSRAMDVAGASIATIADLVDKSQLRKGLDGRYEMHGLALQYARSKLKQVPEIENMVRDVHASTFTGLLKEWEPGLKGGRRGEYLRDFGAEIGNVRTAWDWAINQRRVDLILSSLQSLWLYFETRNWFSEGYEQFKRAAEVIVEHNQTSGQTGLEITLSKLHARQSWFAWRLGRYTHAEELAQTSLDLAIESASMSDQAFSRLILGIVNYVQGELGEAKGYLDESLIQWKEIEDSWGVATALFYLGLVTHARGEFGETQQPYQYGMELFKEAGYQFGATFSHTSLGRVVQTLGDFMKAKRLCEESLSIRRELGDSWGIASCLDSLGVLECGLGELDDAMVACLESLEIRKRLGDMRGVATSLNNLSHVAYLREEYDQAIRYCEEGLVIRRDLGNQRGIAASLNFLGIVTSTLNDHQGAKDYLLESLKIRQDLGDKTAIAESLNNLGSITLKIGNTDEGFEYLKKAFEIAAEIGAIPLGLEALFGLAEWFLEGEDAEKAVELLSIVAHHDAGSQELKSKAQEIFQTLSEDAQDRSLHESWKRGAGTRIEEVEALIMGKKN